MTSPKPRATFWGRTLPNSIRHVRFLWGGLLLAAMVAVVFFTYRSIERELRTTLDQKLTAVLLTNVQATQKWLDRQRLMVSRLAAQPTVQDALRVHQGDPGHSDAVGALPPLSWVTELQGLGVVESYALLDPARQLVTSSPDGSCAQQLEPNDFEQLERTAATVRPANLEPGGGARAPRLSVLGVVTSQGQKLGYLAICLEPSGTMSSLSMAPWGRSGRTFAFDAQGRVFAGMTPPRGANAQPFRRLVAEAQDSPGPVPHLVLDVDGERLDNGRVGAFSWLPHYRLGIVTEIDRTEAYESVAVLRRAFVVLVVLIGGAMLGFMALGRWTLRVREESALVSQRLGRLARAIQPLSAALEHDPGAVVLIDDEGIVVYANAATRQILGADVPWIGKPAHELFERLHPELREAVVAGVEAIVAQKPGQDDETLLVTSRSLRIEGRPHFMYTLRPVTREVRRQEVDHWKKLIRVLSHELNNSLAPISSLVSSARTLNDQHFHDAKLALILDAIVERTSHLVTFLESYRSIARLPRPTPRALDWDKFLAGISLQRGFHIVGPLPSEPGYFDPIQLERVLINTLDNAAEAGSPAESVEVSVEREEEGHRLEIMDRGTGMTAAVLRQAMLPFFSTKQSGTGVGLALCREIVEAHGGHMTLANREGGGLVVSIFLPKARPAALSERAISLRSGPAL